MADPIAPRSRRAFVLQLLGLAGAAGTATTAIGNVARTERGAASPVLIHNGRWWHTHETIDHLVGTWDIRWCYTSDCAHTLEQIGTTDDGYRIWHLRNFHRPPDPEPGDAIPPASIDRTPPLRRYFQDDDPAG